MELSKLPWEERLYVSLRHCDFEQAYELYYHSTPLRKKYKQLYEDIMKIVSSVKDYFKNAFESNYQVSDVEYLFKKMNDDARNLQNDMRINVQEGKLTK